MSNKGEIEQPRRESPVSACGEIETYLFPYAASFFRVLFQFWGDKWPPAIMYYLLRHCGRDCGRGRRGERASACRGERGRDSSSVRALEHKRSVHHCRVPADRSLTDTVFSSIVFSWELAKLTSICRGWGGVCVRGGADLEAALVVVTPLSPCPPSLISLSVCRGEKL